MSEDPPREIDGFVEREHPRLVGALGLYTGDRLLAEELAQEALARACRDWERIAAMRAPGAYVHRIAVNLANSWFRRARARRRALERLGDPADRGDEDPSPADAVAVRAAVAELTPKRRTAIVLCFFLGYSTGEAADVMGVEPPTVRSLLHRAKADLAATLDDDTDATETIRHG